MYFEFFQPSKLGLSDIANFAQLLKYTLIALFPFQIYLKNRIFKRSFDVLKVIDTQIIKDFCGLITKLF